MRDFVQRQTRRFEKVARSRSLWSIVWAFSSKKVGGKKIKVRKMTRRFRSLQPLERRLQWPLKSAPEGRQAPAIECPRCHRGAKKTNRQLLAQCLRLCCLSLRSQVARRAFRAHLTRASIDRVRLCAQRIEHEKEVIEKEFK